MIHIRAPGLHSSARSLDKDRSLWRIAAFKNCRMPVGVLAEDNPLSKNNNTDHANTRGAVRPAEKLTSEICDNQFITLNHEHGLLRRSKSCRQYRGTTGKTKNANILRIGQGARNNPSFEAK